MIVSHTSIENEHRARQGFATFGFDDPLIPVLVSVPHGGRDYPPEILDKIRIPHDALVRLEDRYSDLLARQVIKAGLPVIVAHRARAWLDLNRSEGDLDPDMVIDLDRSRKERIKNVGSTAGLKVRGGLGLIPRRLSGEGDIWNSKFTTDEIRARVSSFHSPYHQAVSTMLEKMRNEFGAALLIDLHSMPPLSDDYGKGEPQFVIGDRYGRSSANIYPELMLEHFQHLGFRVRLNHPYAGEYMLARHGQPKHNIHAVQLEIDRSLYLDELLREPTVGVQKIAQEIGEMVNILADVIIGKRFLQAAE